MRLQLTLTLALLGYCGCAFAAAASSASDTVQSAIQLVKRQVPEASLKTNGKTWKPTLTKVIRALQSDPTFDRLLLQDAQAAYKTKEEKSSSPTFNCHLEASAQTPTSVHRLRPADVKVIGGMGDSLTAGNGALATTVLGLLIEYRGFAWSMGGETEFSNHTSLPNLLRIVNSDLVGHSTGSGSEVSAFAGFNTAQVGRTAEAVPDQAIDLVNRMKTNRDIDFENDWKVITLLIGGNDACDYCTDKENLSPAAYVENIKTALDYLHENVPRAFVNLAEVLDVSLVRELKKTTFTCNALLSTYLCKCAAAPQSEEAFQEIKQVLAGYQQGVRDLVNSGRYDTRDDFTVVVQPFYRDSAPPKRNGRYDVSYLAPDCFHFSAKGHGEAGKALWNNMLEPVGQKSTSWTPGGEFQCPTEDRPYFMTSKNS